MITISSFVTFTGQLEKQKNIVHDNDNGTKQNGCACCEIDSSFLVLGSNKKKYYFNKVFRTDQKEEDFYVEDFFDYHVIFIYGGDGDGKKELVKRFWNFGKDSFDSWDIAPRGMLTKSVVYQFRKGNSSRILIDLHRDEESGLLHLAKEKNFDNGNYWIGILKKNFESNGALRICCIASCSPEFGDADTVLTLETSKYLYELRKPCNLSKITNPMKSLFVNRDEMLDSLSSLMVHQDRFNFGWVHCYGLPFSGKKSILKLFFRELERRIYVVDPAENGYSRIIVVPVDWDLMITNRKTNAVNSFLGFLGYLVIEQLKRKKLIPPKNTFNAKMDPEEFIKKMKALIQHFQRLGIPLLIIFSIADVQQVLNLRTVHFCMFIDVFMDLWKKCFESVCFVTVQQHYTAIRDYEIVNCPIGEALVINVPKIDANDMKEIFRRTIKPKEEKIFDDFASYFFKNTSPAHGFSVRILRPHFMRLYSVYKEKLRTKERDVGKKTLLSMNDLFSAAIDEISVTNPSINFNSESEYRIHGYDLTKIEIQVLVSAYISSVKSEQEYYQVFKKVKKRKTDTKHEESTPSPFSIKDLNHNFWWYFLQEEAGYLYRDDILSETKKLCKLGFLREVDDILAEKQVKDVPSATQIRYECITDKSTIAMLAETLKIDIDSYLHQM